MSRRLNVLVIDDSAVVRQALNEILSSDPEIASVETANDPYVAADRLRHFVPDVMTLDIEMPRMDGLTFLRRLMAQHPIPVVICTSLEAAGLHALELGAVDVITKPKLGTKVFLEEARIRICDAVKAAAKVKVNRVAQTLPRPAPKLTADVELAKGSGHANIGTTDRIVAVGASTGGTEALREFLLGMPHDCPGIVIVQHMPEEFTAAFARRLDAICAMQVKEAADGDAVTRGRALIAPGNRHTLLKRSGSRYHVEIKDGPLVSRHRPSVDVLFRSVARYAGENAIGVIMTGMGDDGAAGMAEMKEAGATNLAQDEASCVVFGMPAEAIRRAGVDKVLPLTSLAGAVIRLCLGAPSPE